MLFAEKVTPCSAEGGISSFSKISPWHWKQGSTVLHSLSPCIACPVITRAITAPKQGSYCHTNPWQHTNRAEQNQEMWHFGRIVSKCNPLSIEFSFKQSKVRTGCPTLCISRHQVSGSKKLCWGKRLSTGSCAYVSFTCVTDTFFFSARSSGPAKRPESRHGGRWEECQTFSVGKIPVISVSPCRKVSCALQWQKREYIHLKP